MSGNRGDLHKAKVRRDRIRRKKDSERAPPPPPALQHPFAAERGMRELHAVMEGHIEDANARLTELTAGGRLSEMAAAWKKDDPKWQAQELAYDALETDDLLTALELVTEALRLDPDNTDASRLMVSLLPAEPANKVLLMREVVAMAERNFGPDFFERNTGHFWGMIETRPYMRAKLHLAELLTQMGQIDEAIEVYERMLVLNPRDNQGHRYRLLGMYLAAGSGERAGDLLGSYDEETVTATWAWGRVVERWQAGEMAEAGAALARARKVNRYAEGYLTGKRAMPDSPPEYVRMGDDSDAQGSAFDLLPALEAHPDFRRWLRAQK